jgi:hypothetical protein
MNLLRIVDEASRLPAGAREELDATLTLESSIWVAVANEAGYKGRVVIHKLSWLRSISLHVRRHSAGIYKKTSFN